MLNAVVSIRMVLAIVIIKVIKYIDTALEFKNQVLKQNIIFYCVEIFSVVNENTHCKIRPNSTLPNLIESTLCLLYYIN